MVGMEALITGLDRALRTVFSVEPAARDNPASALAEAELSEAERRHAAALMRVNHAGEVAAQALYEGQAATARSPEVRTAMATAAAEETDHLAWCNQRLTQLGARPSLLGPVWYAGSFAIGALAGLAGDRWSLGFVAETERQVVRHLEDHELRLPLGDTRSRAIVAQMKLDEARHGTVALEAGGCDLPGPVRRLMRAMSKVMTTTAYRI